jgi:hypothetical protein
VIDYINDAKAAASLPHSKGFASSILKYRFACVSRQKLFSQYLQWIGTFRAHGKPVVIELPIVKALAKYLPQI